MEKETWTEEELEILRKQTDESIDRFAAAFAEFCKKAEEMGL